MLVHTDDLEVLINRLNTAEDENSDVDISLEFSCGCDGSTKLRTTLSFISRGIEV